ncbi:cytochrome C [Sulfurimonas aquatica]|uniref:Cytochrome C n=1 Tax=Sulfurimonas aquatica TaxID=2672570 RepID=A0A975GCA8_9BACT|nr:cytochrome C [Sulfurimonas aquatica]QSZ41317.1 cytochrome C [Sulfurimonas aquatica]
MKKIVIASIATLALATSSMAAAVNGKACLACHGADWSKKAMGKSKVVSEMTHADIAASLKGYKNGTYGGPMKGIMKGQVGRFSDAELDAFAQTIGK